MQERADEVNRLQKVLETASIKLAAVARDVLGKSGRAMLEAIIDGEEIDGEEDAAVLAELARRRLRQKLPELREALQGRVQDHHRFLLRRILLRRILLRRILVHVDFLDEAIVQVQQEIEERLVKDEEIVARLQTIPGVGATAAAVIVAEIGKDHIFSQQVLC